MENQESQWINLADIMSALMMIFMFISIALLYEIISKKIINEELLKKNHEYKIINMKKENITKELLKKNHEYNKLLNKNKNLINKKNIYRLSLNKELHKEFDKDLIKWKAIITPDNIIRFNSPFKIGKANIPKDYQIILNDFFPRYIKVLSLNKLKNEIAEIRVEGHTSNIWGKLDQRKSYLSNMTLSQDRASNVLSYCFNIDNKVINNNIKWLQSNLRANGMSFSKLLYKDEAKTIQDKNRSRRVEFKVIIKEHIS